jgi:2-haloalkanoic acid dehalogenase type II
MRPRVLSFDIFGTVVDWRRGLLAALARQGAALDEAGFDRVIDAQGAEERGDYRPYREITARSLIEVAGLPVAAADEVAAGIGDWPLFSDSAAAFARLLEEAICVAMTNSDRVHRQGVERQLGLRLTHWICAEDLRLYKPDERFWRRTAERIGEPLSPAWWHVSAYADYDLDAARRLGLTTVFVSRPHNRPGPADRHVADLLGLAGLVEQAAD